MENTEFIKNLIREYIAPMEERIKSIENHNNRNAVSLVDIQEQPEVGKPGELSLEDHIRMLKEERKALIEKLNLH